VIPVVTVVKEREIGVSVIVAEADFVVSVLLVAVTVAEVPVITAGAVYTPAEVIVPLEAVHVTPALAPSAVTVVVKVCVAPPIRVTVVGLTETLMGVSVIAAVADFVVSVLLVAVTVAVVVVTTAGAVYTPVAVIVPVEAAHVTPALAPSAVTVAVKVWLAPPMSVTVVGMIATLIGVSVIVAIADFVVSVLLVAVTVAVVVVTTAGAVYTPPEVTVPVEAAQVTPASAESFDTVAVKVWLAPPMSVTIVGLTATLIAGGAGLPPPQPIDSRDIAVKAANMNRNKRPLKFVGRLELIELRAIRISRYTICLS